VANLTPDQLSRKRANDREAQRSIRQRTKLRIHILEARINKLTRECNKGALEMAKRRNSELEDELRQLRGMLGRLKGSSTLLLDFIPYHGNCHIAILESYGLFYALEKLHTESNRGS
jgi:hypothetical protein